MHWVDRGSEPDGLEEIRARYTPGWVKHYQQHAGQRPGDAHWRNFRGALEVAFWGLCAYCEETCEGEVDHLTQESLS